MNIANALEEGFLRRLSHAFRDHHSAGKWLLIAAGMAEPERPALVENALRRGSTEMRETLLIMMANGEAPLIDCARAAVVYLRGVTLGHWAGAPKEINAACGLVSSTFGDADNSISNEKNGRALLRGEEAAARPTREKRPLYVERNRNVAILRECALLERALKRGTDEEMLSAIEHWGAAMEYLGARELVAEARQ